jgi:hypothetical protein
MSNYYSTSLGLILQNAGENSTTWGSFVNTNFQTLLEQAIVGQTTVAMVNADYTLTSAQGVSNEARNAVLIITGNQNATYNVIVPAVPKLYIITNNLNSSATAYFKVTGSSTSFSIANGNTVIVYCTGSNVGTAFYPVNYVGGSTASNFTVNGTLNVTGATTLSSTLYVGGVVTTAGGINASGTITASSFSGAGTGLTGTASSLTAGTATTANALNPSNSYSINGLTSQGDVTIYRSATPTTGVVYLGNSGSRYLYYDGTNYNLNGANLYVNSSLAVTNNGSTYGINISGTATTANALNSSNNYTVQNLNALNGVQINGGGLTVNTGNSTLWTDVIASINTGNFYIGGSSGTYAVINRLGFLALNGGLPYKIVTNDGGTYGINISGNAATASSANALNTSNSYSVASLNVSGAANVAISSGDLQIGNLASQWVALRYNGTMSINNGTYYQIVRSDGGSYNINIGGNAGSATFAGYANALNTSNAYQCSGMTITGQLIQQSDAFLGYSADAYVHISSSGSIGRIDAVNGANTTSRWLGIGNISPLLIGGVAGPAYGASVTVGNSNGNGGIWCFAGDNLGQQGWAMVNTDGRLGGWTVGSGSYLAVIIDGTAYGINFVPSDESLKKNIEPSTYNALDTIDKIQFKSFDYDPTKTFLSEHIDCGVTSQQLETVDPNLVMEVGDLKQPSTDKLLYVAMKAIQELKAEVDSLKTELAALKG